MAGDLEARWERGVAASAGRGLLWRELRVMVNEEEHRVAYDGSGLGHETVYVDGSPIRVPSAVWFVPRFEFTLARLDAALEIRIWPWLTVRDLRLYVHGRLVYSERPVRPVRF